MSTTTKVYVINPPKPAAQPAATQTGSRVQQTTYGDPNHTRQPPGYESAMWRRVAKAYALGPVLNVVTRRTRLDLAWAIAGVGALVTAIALFVFRSSVFRLLDTMPGGVVLWMIAATLPALIAAAAWSRSIVIAGGENPPPRNPGRRWWRNPNAVGALGVLVPGLGLFVAGCRWRAAGALLLVGTLAGSLTMLAQWHWIWQRSLADVSSGISGTSLEVALVVAGTVAFLSILAWTTQALDGARRASSSRPTTTSSALSVLLLVTIVFFAVAFQPVSFADDIGATAASLRHDGFRLIPVILCEVAARLDPASAVPVARAAAIYDEMGMTARAQARRSLIEQRLQEYLAASRQATQAAAAMSATGSSSWWALDPPIHGASDHASVLRLDPAGSNMWAP